jgi:hypothetical protein
MFCAQIVGKPLIAPEPTAAPAVLKMVRRPIRPDDVAPILTCPLCGVR